MRIFGALCLSALWLAQASAAPSCGAVKVTQLSVDGRTDEPLDISNKRPTLAWQMIQVKDCDDVVCPGDEQTAYRVQAALTVDELRAGKVLWDSGKTRSKNQLVRFGGGDTAVVESSSRSTVVWRVRVWDANVSDPLPVFVRQFHAGSEIAQARLYVSGVGLHHATVNGEEVTDEILGPGYSNLQLSSEYRTHDITHALRHGANSIGVSLGHGAAYVNRSISNPRVGRRAPYAWWQSSRTGNTSLEGDVPVGAISLELKNSSDFHIGGTVNIDTGNGGQKLESRTISDIVGNIIHFTQGLKHFHFSRAFVSGSGDNIAGTEATAGASVTPRLIARLEITYKNGSTDIIVTDRSWRTSLGALVTDAWYAGSDYDARREQKGWNEPDADLSSGSWISAGISPPPNLATKLVSRNAEVIKIQEKFSPISVSSPAPGVWVFDLGQNIAGLPLLTLPEMKAGTIIRITPAESLNSNGTVNQTSLSVGPGGESWHPRFQYFAMQFVQIDGLPDSYEPTVELVTGLRVQADVPRAGTFVSSSERLNRIHNMVWYSVASNMMSIFTDCPGREKMSYPADYTQPFGAIYRNFGLNAFLRTHQRHLVEGQSIDDTPMFGNVALKVPVFDWGYSGRFGDEINWGNAIALVPSLLNDLYGDTSVMAATYNRMVDFVDYITREKADGYVVDAGLADWVADTDETSGLVTGTWGYYLTVKAMARMASLTGHDEDAERYAYLSGEIRDAFNAHFWDEESGCYRSDGPGGRGNVTQATQALARRRTASLRGTIGLGPIVRALTAGHRDHVLWESLQQNDEPSYGFFLEATVENPNGFTTIGERWTRGSSKNHMILAQIEEWFHAGVVGIQPLALKTLSTTWDNKLVFQPKPVGNLTSAEGTYQMPAGEVHSKWTLSTGGSFNLSVTVPPNEVAEVYVLGSNVKSSGRAKEHGRKDGFSVFTVPSGTHTFTATLRDNNF